MTGHTPEPWIIDFNQFETGIAIVPKEAPSLIICEVWPHDESLIEPDIKKDRTACANAALIVTAPELLAALTEILTDLNRIEDDNVTDAKADTFCVCGNISYGTVSKARELLHRLDSIATGVQP